MSYVFSAGGWRLAANSVTAPGQYAKAQQAEALVRTYRAEASRLRSNKHLSDAGRLDGLAKAGQEARGALERLLDTNTSWLAGVEAHRTKLLAAVAPPDAVTEARAVEIRAALRRADPSDRLRHVQAGLLAPDRELLLALWRDPARAIEPMVGEQIYARIDEAAPRYALTAEDAAKLAEAEAAIAAATIAHEVLITGLTKIADDMKSPSGGSAREHAEDARRAELLAQQNAA